MTPPKQLTSWQQATTPPELPRHIRRNIAPGANGCWLWLLSRSRDGYGWASLDDKTYQAHRLIYILLRGEPAAGLTLDHLCRVRHCVNPDHLEAVPNRENLRRGDTPTGWQACQRCGSSFVVIGRRFKQRRCPQCLAAYEAHRKRRSA